MTTQTDTRLDPDRLNALLGQAVVEFGATVNAALVVIGDRLGLYRTSGATKRADGWTAPHATEQRSGHTYARPRLRRRAHMIHQRSTSTGS
jgi:hypothetical protein